MGRALAMKLAHGSGPTRGVRVVGYDADPAAREAAALDGVETVEELEKALSPLEAPRTVWLMVPAALVEEVIAACLPHLSPGDLLVDGGNSYFRDSQRRAPHLTARGVQFVDIGISGGPGGGPAGFSLMVGGNAAAVSRIEPLLGILASPEGAFGHVGPSGAGHFVKMVHNGIEYGMMEALAEGVDVLRHGPYQDLDLAEVARVWKSGSVIRSYLVDLLAEILRTEDLEAVVGRAEATGEGEWTVKTAEEIGLDVPAIAAAVARRGESQRQELFVAKILSLLRNRFGGHPVQRKSS